MMDHFYWLQPLANIKPNNIYIYISFLKTRLHCVYTIHHLYTIIQTTNIVKST